MKNSNKMSSAEFRKLAKHRRPLSEDFIQALNLFGGQELNRFEQEYRFYPLRKWRFDFAWPTYKVAVECDGMVWQAGGGRHNTDADREKINTAALLGWRVLRFSGKQIKNDPIGCIEILKKTLNY